MDTEKQYETHDIYLAAYLKLVGCVLVNRYKQGSRRWIFVFESPDNDIKLLRASYYSGSQKVIAKDFAREIQDFKQLCFE